MRAVVNEPYVLMPILLIFILIGLWLYNDRVSNNYLYSRQLRMRMAVVATLGGPCLPVFAQCCTSRNLSEGIYARRSDLPGGFCFHSDCDVIFGGDISSERHYTLKVVKLKSTQNQ